MNSQWNVGGPLSMNKIPPEYAEFTKQKQKQLLNNILSSSAIGVLLANAVAVLSRDASFAVLTQTVTAQIPLLVIVAIASLLAKK